MTIDLPRLLTPAEAAELLGVRCATLANWRWRGKGPAFTKVESCVRYRLEDLEDYLRDGVRNATRGEVAIVNASGQ